MFTGIIEEVGTVSRVEQKGGGVHLFVAAPMLAQELKVNDSISINGVCQTVIRLFPPSEFEVEAVEETLKKTTLGSLRPGSRINLELPMRLNERLGGHLVLGHVDTFGEVTEREDRESSWVFTIEIPRQFSRYIVPVGSVALDGVSLTIAEVDENRLKVSIIPHTMENTIFSSYQVGTKVNIEFDIVGKYIERIMTGSMAKPPAKKFFTVEKLREEGF